MKSKIKRTSFYYLLPNYFTVKCRPKLYVPSTLVSGIDVGQGINVGPVIFCKNIKQNVQTFVEKKKSNLKISMG